MAFYHYKQEITIQRFWDEVCASRIGHSVKLADFMKELRF
jgi:hypothetical protein